MKFSNKGFISIFVKVFLWLKIFLQSVKKLSTLYLQNLLRSLTGVKTADCLQTLSKALKQFANSFLKISKAGIYLKKFFLSYFEFLYYLVKVCTKLNVKTFRETVTLEQSSIPASPIIFFVYSIFRFFSMRVFYQGTFKNIICLIVCGLTEVNIPFLYPLKTSVNQKPLSLNGLMTTLFTF